jgi:uncharacterized protein YjiS (DUF1127 family)
MLLIMSNLYDLRLALELSHSLSLRILLPRTKLQSGTQTWSLKMNPNSALGSLEEIEPLRPELLAIVRALARYMAYRDYSAALERLSLDDAPISPKEDYPEPNRSSP